MIWESSTKFVLVQNQLQIILKHFYKTRKWFTYLIGSHNTLSLQQTKPIPMDSHSNKDPQKIGFTNFDAIK